MKLEQRTNDKTRPHSHRPEGVAVPLLVENSGSNAVRCLIAFFSTLGSIHSVRAYKQTSYALFRWLETFGVTCLAEISPRLLLEYRTVLLTTRAVATVSQHIAIMRTLFDWFVNHGILDQSPASNLRGPDRPSTDASISISPLAAEAIQRFLESTAGNRLADYRNRAMISLSLLGLKPSTLITLKTSDFRREAGEAYLYLDSGKERLMLPHHVAEAIERYCLAGEIDPAQADPLFRTIFGKTSRLNAAGMSRNDLYRILRRAKIVRSSLNLKRNL